MNTSRFEYKDNENHTNIQLFHKNLECRTEMKTSYIAICIHLQHLLIRIPAIDS